SCGAARRGRGRRARGRRRARCGPSHPPRKRRGSRSVPRRSTARPSSADFYRAHRMHADITPVALRALIARIPLMMRALVLVPLLSFGLDQARVSLVCGPDAQSCLDAAGNGRLGAVGVAIIVGYALAIAGLVARVARGRSAPAL